MEPAGKSSTAGDRTARPPGSLLWRVLIAFLLLAVLPLAAVGVFVSHQLSQVRESASRLMQLAKGQNVSVFLVGHVTKAGAIAGPRVLEHIVDTVLYLEGDRFHAYRLLRSVKNRFGATSEVGVFEMGQQGLQEVLNPSEAFLAERWPNAAGSAIAVTTVAFLPPVSASSGMAGLRARR